VPKTENGISVIIVTCNSQPVLKTCLQSVKRQTVTDRLEIIIADNNSSDNSAEMAHEICPEARVIRMTRNAGFAAACNQAASQVSGESLLFINPDTELDDTAIESLEQEMVAQERPGLLTARLRNPDGSFQPNCRAFPTPANLFLSRGSLLSKLPGLARLSRTTYSASDYEVVTAVPAVSATLAIIRASLFQEVRGFDERFFMYMEDTDLSYRLHLAGYKNYFVPAAGASHRWGTGGRASHMFRAWHHHKSVWKYFLKHFPNGYTLLLLPVLLAVNLVLVFIFGGRKQGD